MRIVYSMLAAAFLGATFFVQALWTSGRFDSAVPPPAPNAAVVAELFTSEGCSSCPPADELLTRLVQQQPLKGITVLGLSEHVDYWNHLGWTDPFSSAANTDRQAQYAGRLTNIAGGPYTPEVVVDGAAEAVGSDTFAVEHKIAQAATQTKAALSVTILPVSVLPRSLQLQISVQSLPAPLRESSELIVAVTEDRLTSNVRRGENSGRHLEHNGVVRSMQSAAILNAGEKQWTGRATVTLQPEWKRENLKVIAFLQERGGRHIVGAGWAQLASARG